MTRTNLLLRLPRGPGLSLAAVLLALTAGCAAELGTAPQGAPAGAMISPAREEVEVFAFSFSADGLPRTAMLPLSATITEPGGKVLKVLGYRDGQQVRLHYRPRVGGEHRYVIEMMGGRRWEGTFLAARNASWGGVRRDPTHPTLLRAESSGEPFFMLGDNRINVYDPRWNYNELEAADYVHYLADHGITTMRVFIFGDAEGEELPDNKQLGALESELGVFDPEVAASFDRIFAAAEERGVMIILTAFAVGFTPGDVWKGWEDNPYSTARGGPFEHPRDFFTMEEARPLARQRIQYIAARWGHWTSFLAIDLLNEPEWDGDIPESMWIPWAKDMARTWRAADPYGRLITAGPVGPSWVVDGHEEAWYQSELNDIVQWHLYGPETYDPHALALEMTKRVQESQRYGKPVLCGEFGYGGEPKDHHPHTHIGAFAAAFSGAGALGHSAPLFNIDSDQPMTPRRARRFGVLNTLLGELPWDEGLRPVFAKPTGEHDAWVWRLASEDGRHQGLWVLAPPAHFAQEARSYDVSLGEVPRGHYRVQWWDDMSGEPVGEARSVEHPGGELVLPSPALRRHLVARLVDATAGPRGQSAPRATSDWR